MKGIRLMLMLFLLTVVGRGMAQASFGQPVNFDNGWRFILADDQSYKNAATDDSKWRKLDLPHDWSVEGRLSPSLASCTGYLPGGIGWYRKH
ncbi:MAG: glycoside hydrolase family 2, partial [Muribaculaceae bacterium]|nr:glycoside hydrolase family 2 [Muribaculaceae bacterium]